MNSVSRFIFLLSLICHANCRSIVPVAPLTEFDIDFQKIEKFEKLYQNCSVECKEPNSAPSTAKGQESKCQCFIFPHTENCTYQVIENELRKHNMVCNSSDTGTHGTCRILERVKNLVSTSQALCGIQVSPRYIFDYIRTEYQKSNS